MGTIFSAYDIRGRVGDSLTTEYVWTVGKAFAEWLPEEGSVVIVKGAGANDTTAHALTEGLLLQGRDVIDGGQGDQQAVTGAIGDSQAAGGVLINHDELQDLEIITLFDARGVVVTADAGLASIEELITAGNFVPAAEKGSITSTSSS